MRAVALVALLVGCNADIDPEWQLDHDRIIAVRATPPRILPGERAELDALVGRKGDGPIELKPPGAEVVSPASLASALTFEGGGWGVTAPDEAQLAAARAELMLEPGAPVPLTIGVGFTAGNFPSGEGPFAAIKTVWLGESRQNPVLDSAMVDGAPAPQEIVVPPLVDVPLHVDFDDNYIVTWLTSVGQMHDFDLPSAYLRVEVDDELREGHLAVVIRDLFGGVVWRTWSIRVDE